MVGLITTILHSLSSNENSGDFYVIGFEINGSNSSDLGDKVYIRARDCGSISDIQISGRTIKGIMKIKQSCFVPSDSKATVLGANALLDPSLSIGIRPGLSDDRASYLIVESF